jgi:small subunit ribosomal protein S12
MSTLTQILFNYPRSKKIRKIKTPALNNNPQKKGVCVKIYTRTPKKPNSAIRKVVKVRLSTKKQVESYIPGIGHTLQDYGAVLIRGGRVADLPGVKYHSIRGKFDFKGVTNRKRARSKYGTKKEKKK